MSMEREEVITEFCRISNQVMNGVFHCEHAADCFCKPQDPAWNYQYDKAVLNYIRTAVYEKMKRESHNIPDVK